MSEVEVKQIFQNMLEEFIQKCCVYNDHGDVIMKRQLLKDWFEITDE